MLVELSTHWQNVDSVTDAYDIAADYLVRRGLIARQVDPYDPLLDEIIENFRTGVRNKIRLANRAIVRFERSLAEIRAGTDRERVLPSLGG
jgi:hypothetical protein